MAPTKTDHSGEEPRPDSSGHRRPALQFGYNAGLPADRTVAWGARLIVTQDGDVDMLWDRQDSIGPDEPRRRLVEHVNSLRPNLRDRVADLLRDRVMRTGVRQDHLVHGDDTLVIRANTNASHGYCYVVAYFADPKAEVERR